MLKAHKIKLNLTPEQEQYFWRAAGTARFAFNWGLAEYNRALDHNRQNPDNKIQVSGRLLKKQFTQERPEWVAEVTTWAVQGAFDDLQAAFSRYFDIVKGKIPAPPRKNNKPRNDGRPHHWPRFKARNKTTPAFYLANSTLHFDGHQFWFDWRRVGWINMTESLRLDGKVMGARISYQSGHWWLSVQVAIDDEPIPESRPESVYVDLGVRYLAKTSDGRTYQNPRALPKALKKLRRLQRHLDRQRRANNPDNYNENGTVKAGPKTWIISQNMKKTRAQIIRLHYRIKCLRQEAAHLMTTEIARSYGLIVIEDLDIKEMLGDNPTAKYLADAALYEKRRQLEYKAKWYGGRILIVDKFEPTNKQCNACGSVNDALKIGAEKWECPNCGRVNDKYNNSILNIKDFSAGLPNGDGPGANP